MSGLWSRVGALKLAAFALALSALVVPSFGGCGLMPSGNDTKPEAPKCESAVHCDDANPCTIDVCGADGVCAVTPVDGDPPSQPSGDCQRVTCQAGAPTTAPDDLDVDDGNACTTDVCQAGSPTHTNADGEPCLLGAGSGVCKTGACVVSCASDSDSCDDANPCTEDACDLELGECVHDSAKLHGILLSDRDLGDCNEQRCKNGVTTTVPDDSEVPNDSNDCTDDTCAAGSPVHTNIPLNSTCGLTGGMFCNATGQCVQCNDPTQCGTNNDCNTFTCVTQVCGVKYSPVGTVVTAQTDGDCQEAQCNASGGIVMVDDNNDLPDDGNDCSNDLCTAGDPGHTDVSLGDACMTPLGPGACDGNGNCRKDVGSSCLVGLECSTNFCIDGRCCESACTTACKSCGLFGLEGTCSNISQFLEDAIPANVCTGTNSCDGAGACKKDNGQVCAVTADCTSGNCVDGRCCNNTCTAACKACNVAGSFGTCTNIPVLMEDSFPANACDGANSCDGAGICKKDNGQTCTAAGDCASGSCIDGRCCNTACGGTCQACDVAGVEGTCSNIPQFSEDNFPVNACTGANSCNGAGACKEDNGQMCAAASECASGFCVDGRCCGSTCTTTCQACNIAGSEGTCSSIPALSEDAFPANACNGASSCDGAGNCRKDNGQTCTLTTECASGFCVDGRCCNNTCSTTCQACNVPGFPGLCSNIVALTEDNFPVNACNGISSCDGAGNCRNDNGQACAVGTECASGFCVDGRCCNNACTTTCQACNIGGLEGMCSNLAIFTEDNVPANACNGASSCDGVGGCKKDNGQMCAAGAECTSGNCVDGRCCNNTCNTACKACNLAGIEGTCSNIDPFVEDDFPVNACTGASSCDGNGNCRKDNGQMCAAAAECTSGLCVDGRCCNGLCTTLCKACNVAGFEGACTNIPPLTEDNFPVASCVGVNSCDGAGNCLKDNGQTCAVAAECASGNCIDGRCCNTGCGTPCQACNLTGIEGTCSPIPAQMEDNFPLNACTGALSCNGAGVCTKDNGQTCAMASDCSSGLCVDGVCCGSACTTACQACNVAGSVGACSNLGAGTEDNFPANACTGVNSCNGAGVCTKDNGEACSMASQCTSGFCVDGVCCGTTCTTPCQACNVAGSVGTCSNLGAGAEDNFPANACTGVNSCNAAGVCTKDNGELCSMGADCTSGNCVDGLCCDTMCSGACEACSTALKGSGANGVCGPVANGTDPDSDCADDGAATCDHDGSCDGGGACRNYAAGTECLASTCSLVTQEDADTCDGAGTCVDNGTTDCSPYICGASTCNSMCAMDSGCASGFYCTMGGACEALKAEGALCVGANECMSTFCADGVCCNTSCTDTCTACSAAEKGAGSDGTCGVVIDGVDPHNDCMDNGATNCGTDGFCNGAGACRNYASGTECAPVMCSGETQQNADMCNGAGSCVDSGSVGCSPYACGSSTCNSGCMLDTDCASGFFCSGNQCVALLSIGTSCGGPNQCSSGNCVDGFCCDTACADACSACSAFKKGSGSDGFCGVVASGSDPDDECSDALATSCGTDGFCDGAGACRRYAAGTECAPVMCSGETQEDADMCDGSGTCVNSGTSGCAPYICGATECKIGCSTDFDCTLGNFCSLGACVPQLGNGQLCGAFGQCSSGFCTDGLCCDSACNMDCESCTGARTGGNDGVCLDVLAQVDDDNPVCGGTMACDGVGSCKLATGQPCTDGTECASGACTVMMCE